jgi:hypothetical protein
MSHSSAFSEVAYTRDWSGGVSGTPASGTADLSCQLKYRNAPLDQTMITWCNFHAIINGSSMCPVLLASGTAKSVPARIMAAKGWMFATP